MVRMQNQQVAGIYLRISRDDGMDGDSNSIINQKKLLTKAAKEKGYTKIREYCDDGFTGTNTDRKGYQDMVKDIELGKIHAVIVKDLSRLGRIHVEADNFIENILPKYDVRLISVADGIDSGEGENDFTPIWTLINELYSRDISRKVKTSARVKGESGMPLGFPPYGYTKNPNNPKFWIVDEQAAPVVKKIFEWFNGGMGTEQIANRLQEQGIPTPRQYYLSKGIKRGGRTSGQWNRSTVRDILDKREYCGDVVNFKTRKPSYKSKKQLIVAEKDRLVFENVHEPIIDRITYETAKSKRKTRRVRQTVSRSQKLFSGLLKCSDCGGNLAFHKNSVSEIEYFNCQGFNRKLRTCETSHYIRADMLETIVLAEVKRLASFAKRYENEFAREVMQYAEKAERSELEKAKTKLAKMEKRMLEIDNIIQRLYEDNVSGKITDERFVKMSRSYEKEQDELREKSIILSERVERESNRRESADAFLKAVRKYTRIRKLTPELLNELIEHIVIYQEEKIDGKRVQKLDIVYRCIGTIEIPDLVPDVSLEVNTRKGVYLTYNSKSNKKE
ncbi:MAG: recombinase family protein [Clostridia bacterium]|nr:recombinase family protein [Clostridia bacterium]